MEEACRGVRRRATMCRRRQTVQRDGSGAAIVRVVVVERVARMSGRRKTLVVGHFVGDRSEIDMMI